MDYKSIKQELYKFTAFMENNLDEVPLSIRVINFTSLIFLLLGIVILGSFVFLQVLQVGLGRPVSDFSEIIGDAPDNGKLRMTILAAQASTALFSFILIPLAVIFFIWKDLQKYIFRYRRKLITLCFSAALIAIVSIPLIAWMSEVNKSILSNWSFSKELETWILKSEKEAEKLTYIIAIYDDLWGMIAGLIVIAILPAIGEELLFRGLIQNQLTRIFINPHIAILLTGFLFSFIHFQFFGFIPRMFLGVLFGYMYYWSKSIVVPMVMHFTNNALTYFVLNLYKQKKISVDLESTQDMPMSSFVISGVIFLFLIIWFRNQSQESDLSVSSKKINKF